MAVATTPTPVAPTETPAEFVAHTGLGVDAAWRAWRELEDHEVLSRDAFRRAARGA